MHFAMFDNVPYILAADHPFRPRHLLNGMRQEQESPAAQCPKLLLDFAALHHTAILSSTERSSKRRVPKRKNP